MLLQDQRQNVTQRIDPKIIMANTILQLTTVELSQSIENELLENPALDTLEELGCDGDCIDPDNCPYCSARRAKELERERLAETLDMADHEPDYDPVFESIVGDPDDDYDPVGNLEAEMTLADHLRNLLRSTAAPEDYRIGEYLISNLNERGWLGATIENIALELAVDECEVERVLGIIQTFDPPGVGARDLRECMLLQLRYLKDETLAPADRRMNAITELLVRDHFDHVWAKRYVKMARAARVTIDDAHRCLEYIRTRLNPYPASAYRPPWKFRPANNRAEVRPDVVIRRTDFGYDVEIVGQEPFTLCVSPVYRNLCQRSTTASRAGGEERKQIQEYVDRAELFIRNINRRRQTLKLITKCIIEHQTGFIETGSRQFLHTLTRTRVAQMLNMHESIVSRATANKFVALPNQEVVSFDLFFDSSLSVKDAIDQIIRSEDPASPYSDKQIAELLGEQGIHVARRTIVKYRDSQKILSSARRRR